MPFLVDGRTIPVRGRVNRPKEPDASYVDGHGQRWLCCTIWRKDGTAPRQEYGLPKLRWVPAEVFPPDWRGTP